MVSIYIFHKDAMVRMNISECSEMKIKPKYVSDYNVSLIWEGGKRYNLITYQKLFYKINWTETQTYMYIHVHCSITHKS